MKVLVSAITLFLLANSPAFCADIDGVRYDALPEPSCPLPYHPPASNSLQTTGEDAFGSCKSAPAEAPSEKNTIQTQTLEPESAELKADWEQWHSRVAQEIRRRFVSMANNAFNKTRAFSAVASASYTVTRDGRITQVHLLQKSSNPIFNAIALTAITSVSTNSILEFPISSTQTAVNKKAFFTMNSKAEFPSGQVGDFEPATHRYPRPNVLAE